MKKVLILCVCLALGFVAASGTIAYFTDTVEANQNVIEAGTVDVSQHEFERVRDAQGRFECETDANGALTNQLKLAPFTDKAMYPTMAPAVDDPASGTVSQWETYNILGTTVTMPDETFPGIVDKIVTVTNEGSLHAYVRTYIAIPTQWFENGTELVNIPWLELVYNQPSDPTAEADWMYQCVATHQTIEENGTSAVYDIYALTYKKPLLPQQQTSPGLLGIYMCGNVNGDANGYYVVSPDGVRYDIGTTSQLKVLVTSVATQGNTEIMTDGASAAIDLVFKSAEEGAAYHPWQKKN